MEVKVAQLQAGCVTSKDVPGLTEVPLVKRNTVLDEVHLDFLKAFLVETVEVRPRLANGKTFIPGEVKEEPQAEEEKATSSRDTTLVEDYLATVKMYKKLCGSWKEGAAVDMAAVRSTFLTLFEKTHHSPDYLLHLHDLNDKTDYMYHHSVYVGMLSAFLAKKLRLTDERANQVGLCGAMADAGMVKLPSSILRKTGSLTEEEYEKVKKHPIHSYKMLKDVPGVSDSMLVGVLQHHERYDGSGYPLGVTAEKIHLFSQIVAVADVYHAMISERHHRPKRSPFQVLEEIEKERFGKLETKVVEALVQSFVQSAIGSRVCLSTGEEAEVIFFDQQAPTRPMVKLLRDGTIIQLVQEPKLHIVEILKKQ
ncbi:HD-GYP domain-containing protein [Alkalihalobacillus oceani]|uniref:HD-GYP domain-containing protein n=1 Tax=Halalkalibacter oceani TaxID=1653776 RepID=UPI00203F1223|nr:HD-GYP domain-containing protein [Halalkalibacter oceani]MCM3762779.1 HD-GYP domain-containing protein [Halalkalibacter oceani]